MPRTSTVARAVIAPDDKTKRLKPPASLSKSERILFEHIVSTLPASHFRPADVVLLTRYCEAAVLAEQAALELREGGAVVDNRASPWIVVQEKCCRVLVALAMRLRLCSQSRLDIKTAGRERTHVGPYPWDDRLTRNGKQLSDDA
jgi:phage terminase small subunit